MMTASITKLDPERVYDAQEIASYLKVSAQTVRRLFRWGRIGPRTYRYLGSEILDALRRSERLEAETSQSVRREAVASATEGIHFQKLPDSMKELVGPRHVPWD